MDFSISAAAMTSALKKIGSIISPKTSIPILGNVLLDVKEGRVTVRGTDLDMDCSITLEADVRFTGSTTVDAHTLEAYCSKLKKDQPIKVTAEGNTLICSQGRSRSKLHTLPPEDYPDFMSRDLPSSFVMMGAEFLEMLNGVRFAISTEETRYYLNGVYLHTRKIANKQLAVIMVSTDGHRMALRRGFPADGAELVDFEGVIIPRTTVNVAIKMLEGMERVHVALGPSQIRLTMGNIILASKLIDGTFPDYERVIPRPNINVVLPREGLATMVDRVRTISKEKGSAVRLEFGNTILKASARDANAGDALEEMDITFDGTPLMVGVNARYLTECLGALDGDSIDIGMIDLQSPLLMRPVGDEGRIVVLMPMRA